MSLTLPFQERAPAAVLGRATQVGENGRGLLRLGTALVPHTWPAQGGPGVMVSASPEGKHAFIRVACERHLGLLMELEITREVWGTQAILQAE